VIRPLVRCTRILARAIHTPKDALLLLEIGAFILRLPAMLRRSDVPTFLGRLASAPRPKAPSIDDGYVRIARLRDACLSMPRFWRRDTCYVRALTLYRFLDPGGKCVQVHVGIEQPKSPGETLRGHAWVSVDKRLFEAPDAVYHERIHEVSLDLVR
jgi:hypothetical protein